MVQALGEEYQQKIIQMHKRILKEKLRDDSVLSEQSDLPPRRPQRPGSAAQSKTQSQLDPVRPALKAPQQHQPPFKIKNRPGSAVRFEESAKGRQGRVPAAEAEEDEGPAADASKTLLLKTKHTLAERDFKVAVLSLESEQQLRFTLYNKKLKLVHSLSLSFNHYLQFMQRLEEVSTKATLLRLLKEIREDPATEGVKWSKKLLAAAQ